MTWVYVLVVPVAVAVIGLLVLGEIDWQLDQWRNRGIDRSFERTAEQIRQLPETQPRPFDYERDAA